MLSLSDEVARRSTFNKLIKEYKAGDNIYQRRNAIREVLSYFGADIGSAREVLNELNTMLDNYDKGIASDEEKDSLNKLMRAVKKVYYQGGHSAEAGIYTVLVPSLAAEYKKKFDPNRLGVATLQGGAIYDVGEYFGNSYVKNPRPRRYGDDLSHGG